LGSSKPQTVEYELPSSREIAKAGFAPQKFMSITPEASFRLGGELSKYLTDRENDLRARTYASFGSPSEVGALARERAALQSASYAASLPRGDKYSASAPFGTDSDDEANDPYAQIRELTQSMYAQGLADAAARRASAANDFVPTPYDPVAEKMASGEYEVPRPSRMRIRPLTAQQRRRRRERERRNAMA